MHNDTHSPTSTRLDLDGGHADVETVEQHVELSVTLGGRACLGLALSPVEAERIARAMLDAVHSANVARAASVNLEGVDTVGDLFDLADDTGIPAPALFEASRYGTSEGACTLS